MKRNNINCNKNKREIKPRKRQVTYNAVTHHLLSDARAVIPAPANSPSLYTGHEVLWYGISLWLVRVSCPGHAPSQLLVHLLTGRAWEAKNP